MSLKSSPAFRSERSFHQSSSPTPARDQHMEKARGLFGDDFGNFMRPRNEPLVFPGKLAPASGRGLRSGGSVCGWAGKWGKAGSGGGWKSRVFVGRAIGWLLLSMGIKLASTEEQSSLPAGPLCPSLSIKGFFLTAVLTPAPEESP